MSLSFRLFGNILADELTLSVLYSLVPVGIPIPVFLLGLFTSGIQALVFPTLAAAYLGESMEVLGEVGNRQRNEAMHVSKCCALSGTIKECVRS